MLKLVRRMLKHYDRYGVIAAFAWLTVCGGMMSATIISAEQVLSHIMHVKPQPAAMFLTAPVVIYIAPSIWASGFLIIERFWMLVGIYQLLGWEDHKTRKQIGRLVGEQ